MKTIISTSLIGVLLGSTAVNAMANEVTLTNKTPNHPMTVVYKIAHKNPGEATVYSSPKKFTIGSDTIQFGLNGYKYAGVVPVSVNGHQLPKSVTQFGQPQSCTVATDKKIDTGSMQFSYVHTKDGRKEYNCSTHHHVIVS